MPMFKQCGVELALNHRYNNHTSQKQGDTLIDFARAYK
jgi:hypothetical protein